MTAKRQKKLFNTGLGVVASLLLGLLVVGQWLRHGWPGAACAAAATCCGAALVAATAEDRPARPVFGRSVTWWRS